MPVTIVVQVTTGAAPSIGQNTAASCGGGTFEPPSATPVLRTAASDGVRPAPPAQQVGPLAPCVPSSTLVDSHADVAAHKRPARAAEASARLGAGENAAVKGSIAGLGMKT